jgi:excisionase family DNA binding protein
VEFLVTLSCGWSIDELARLAESTRRGAQVFATSLVNQQVLALVTDDTYTAGPAADDWKKLRPKTNRGGGAKRYLLCKKTRDELTIRDWKTQRGKLPPLTLQNPQPCPKMSKEDRQMAVAAITERRRFYSVNEVAEILGRSPKTIRHWIKCGELRATKVGGAILIPKHVIDDLKEI